MSDAIAVIGGSGAYTLLQNGSFAGERVGPISTPFGDSQPIHRFAAADAEFLFLSRHGDKGYHIAAPSVNYRANIWALKDLGTARIISWSGPGAIDDSLTIGQYVLPDDLLDETKRRTYTFFEGLGIGFVRQNPVFCPELLVNASTVLSDLDAEHRDTATYVCTEGPRLETPAEIRKYKAFGGDLVGMTLVPEVFLAKELEMCYMSICYVTNYAEGIKPSRFVPGVLFEGLISDEQRRIVDAAVGRFPEIIRELVSRLSSRERTCACGRLMERYRRRGDIGEDWHTWVERRSTP
ncbi:MAG: MTAP family purine nucleoside phosphorylase [Armatimonadetes bacterium]|nr:MTAP family purine nucleoside phosphorylase [Armatimonadota bacterium]